MWRRWFLDMLLLRRACGGNSVLAARMSQFGSIFSPLQRSMHASTKSGAMPAVRVAALSRCELRGHDVRQVARYCPLTSPGHLRLSDQLRDCQRSPHSLLIVLLKCSD